ncbi:hypothetical protein B9Q02_05170 [Candidatus Marsarchaeota G1 archaeon BE_D]|jgi:hypothetical protein|uniref:Uncharacterized protein n=1 Tax=Candidatus Marsarchaeota G1 archaeon BE_D TaxID=1978156 RepID=A0A2R6AH74_9ARCH|nr:MAG: hypothetical protein B9Q02_05170 [Candidatus Marsarchaeota G1 archaeon BE_D]
MDSPLIFKYEFYFSLSDADDALPSSIEGLMGLWEEQPVSLLKGLELGDDSPLCGGSSGAPYCPPNEGCSPEPMVGTMNPLGGNPRP